MKSETPKKIELEGIVRIHDRDKSGNIIQVLFETDSFERFILEQGRNEELLHQFINSRVKISGFINTIRTGHFKILTVESYSLIELDSTLKT